MSVELNRDEARVLGVLVEKSLTTPAQYPLSVNAVVTGSNQRSNREPVMNLSEDAAYDALDSLRRKELVREVDLSGSRVSKYRHVARETLAVETPELVLLAELMLRGPQTVGELRGRASRMHALDSTSEVESLLAGLSSRTPAMVTCLGKEPGGRAARWAQLLSPGLHPLTPREPSAAAPAESPSGGSSGLASRVEALEAQMLELQAAVERLSRGSGLDGVD